MAGDADESGSGPDAPGRGVVGGRNLPVAIAVGVVLAGLFLGALFWHPLAFTAIVAAIMLIAYVESHRVLRPIGHEIQLPVLLAASLIILIGTYQAGHAGQVLGVLVLFLGSIAWQLIARSGGAVVRMLGMTVFFGLWVGFLGSFAIMLVQRPEAGAIAVLAVIGAAILTDIGGYAVGVSLGRHKVAPTISPNKTWEGLIGGLFVATVAGATALPWLHEAFTPQAGAGIALLAGLASFVGDLTESMIKRDLDVKDLGGTLPGHGGVLDRVDGILFALPVGYLAIELLL